MKLPAAWSWTDEETVAANAAGRLAPAQRALLPGGPARIMSAVGRIVEVPGSGPEVRACGVRIEVSDGAPPLPPPATYRLYWLAPAPGGEGSDLLLSAQPLDAQELGEPEDAIAAEAVEAVEVGRVPARSRPRRRALVLAGMGAAAASAAGLILPRLSSHRGSRAVPGPVDESPSPVPRESGTSDGIRYTALPSHAGGVRTLAFSPDGRTLAGGISDGTIRLWDARTGRPTAILTDPQRISTWEVAFHPDGTMLADAQDTIRLWDLASGRTTATLGRGSDDWAWCVAFSPDGALLASGHSVDYLRLWDVAGRKHVASLRGHNAFVLSVAFSPNSWMVASGSNDATVRMWDVSGRSSVNLATLTGHTSTVHSVAFSPDGSTLASGSHDRTIRLWDVSSARGTAVLSGHTSAVTSVAFNPNGRMLASGGASASAAYPEDYPDDNTVRLWDVARRTSVGTLTGHTGSVNSVVFSPDGTTLASGSEDGTVRLWQIP